MITLFGVLLLALGACTWLWAGATFVNARRAKTWPVVRGEVIAKNVFEDGGGEPTFTPQLSYRYVVDGRIYFGTSRRPRGELGQARHSGAVEELAGYRVGRPVRVHHDARNRAASVLDPDDLDAVGAAAVAGALFTAAGAVVLIAR